METKYTQLQIKKRLFAFLIAIAFFVFLIFCKLFYIQIIDGGGLSSRALTQWLRDISVSSARGNIVDRNGVEIASNITVYDVYVRPREVLSSTEIANFVIEFSDSSYEKLLEKITKKGLSEVLLAKN